MRFFLALAAILLPFVAAVFEDEAWKVDYHHALLGLPQRHTIFFHQPQPSSKASLVYVLSELNILGAINPRDGTLVWRQHLPSSTTNTSFLVPGDAQGSIYSGIDGQIASWSAIDGKLIWSVQQDLPGSLVDLNNLEVAREGRKDVVALFRNDVATVQRIDGKIGEPIWQYQDTR
jgi:ER membrane protein complex subunit 1